VIRLRGTGSRKRTCDGLAVMQAHIFCNTRQKTHFCDRHHIASATAALASHSSVPHMRCSRSMVSSQTQPRQRGASLRSYVGNREHSGRRRYHPTTGRGMGGDVGDGFVNNVLSLQLARERAWQRSGGSNGHAFKRLALPRGNSETTGLDERSTSNQGLRERLEAENAQLRRSVAELVLQIQALRDGAGTLSAYDAARHRRDVP
jgi:hypothetical protein